MTKLSFSAILCAAFISSYSFAAPDSTTSPKSDLPNKSDDKKKEDGFSASPRIVTGDDIVLLPAIEASYETIFKRWTESPDGTETKFWKWGFSSAISLNGEISSDDNTDLIKKYLSNGGNIHATFKLRASAGGAQHDSFSAYLFSDYDYLNTKEFTSETETTDLELETAQYGLGLGLKLEERFYLGWEGGRSTILGDEDRNGAFYQAIDDKILQRVVVIWAMDKKDEENATNYIQLFRAWGASDTDAEIGVSFSRRFDINI